MAVTSFNPLEAWIAREGFARFATLPFTLDESQQADRWARKGGDEFGGGRGGGKEKRRKVGG